MLHKLLKATKTLGNRQKIHGKTVFDLIANLVMAGVQTSCVCNAGGLYVPDLSLPNLGVPEKFAMVPELEHGLVLIDTNASGYLPGLRASPGPMNAQDVIGLDAWKVMIREFLRGCTACLGGALDEGERNDDQS